MKNYVIAFSGKAHSGKDTAATAVEKLLENSVIYLYRYAFADKLKSIAYDLFFWDGSKDITEEQDLGRNLLINIGNKLRDIRPNVWIDYVMNNIQRDIDNCKKLPKTRDHIPVVSLITDLRYENEANLLKERENENLRVILVRLNRPGSLHLDTKSELDLDNYKKFDYTIKTRDGDLESLRTKLEYILHQEGIKDTLLLK